MMKNTVKKIVLTMSWRKRTSITPVKSWRKLSRPMKRRMGEVARACAGSLPQSVSDV